MIARVSLPARVLGAVLLAALAGCGPGRNEFAPACPRASLVGPLADLTRYRPGGRDLTDLVLQGRVVTVSGVCKPGETASQLNVAVRVGAELMRGPALQGQSAQVQIFVAVVDNGTILDKKIYPVQFVFPPNVDRGTVVLDEVDMVMPISPKKSGAAYTIETGFQLTPEELEANRQQGAR
jgi:hypothetical protein